MKLLLDTQLLLWAASEPGRLTPATRRLLEDPRHELLFSAASIWEVSIKASLGRERSARQGAAGYGKAWQGSDCGFPELKEIKR
jgi:PIN domain nuclease of toxin-antitoxin system